MQQPIGGVGSWAARVVTYNVPHEPTPYAQFHEGSLIIGIGDFGAEVLDQLCERMDDTNTFNLPNRPLMLHLAFSHVNPDYTGYKSFQYKEQRLEDEALMRVVLQEAPPMLTKDDVETPIWRWMKPFIAAPQLYPRLAARLILFRHLLQGINAELYDLLQRVSQQAQQSGGTPIAHVYIVASAFDRAGANVIGDLAALLRISWGERISLPITAVVCFGEHDITDGTARAERATVALELAHLTSSSRMRWIMPGGLRWNNAMDDLTLLDQGAIGIFGNPDQKGKQATANMLWGLLTSADFRRDTTNTVRLLDPARKTEPTFSLAWSHAAIYPVRFFRMLIARRLMIEVIGDDQVPFAEREGFNLNDAVHVERWMDQVRPQGLLPWLRLYAEQYPSRYLDQIIAQVVQYKHGLGPARVTAARRLEEFVCQSWGRQVPIRAQDWGDYARGDNFNDARAELLNRIGFVSIRRDLLTIVVGGASRPTPIPDPAQIEETFQAIENKLEWYATQLLEVQIQQFLRGFNNRGDDKNNWFQRFGQWRQVLVQSLQGQPIPADVNILRHVLNVDWTRMGLNIQTRTAVDATFAMQTELVPRMPLRNFPPVSNIFLNNLFNMLTFSEHRLALDYFGQNGSVSRLLEIPLSLQTALPYQDAMRYFALWWKACALEQIDFINGDVRAGDWENALWKFIQRYELGHEKDQKYLESPPNVDDCAHPAALPSGTPLAEKLAVVLQRLIDTNRK